jgi:hypothetical protein
MFFWLINTTVISLVFIFVAHSLYEYFKQMYSIPRMRDLVVKPQEDYKEMYKSMGGTGTIPEPIKQEEAPTNSLKEYLKQLKKKPQEPLKEFGSIGDTSTDNLY